MDTQRLFLYMALFIIGLLLWTEWQKESSQNIETKPQVAQESTTPKLVDDKPKLVVTGEVPKSTQQEQVIPASRLIHVMTDILDIQIDQLGGQLVTAHLLKYDKIQGGAHEPVAIFTQDPLDLYYAQASVVPLKGNQDIQVLYKTDSHEYKWAPDQESMDVKLLWEGEDHVQIHRIYTFRKNSYVVEVKTEIFNQSKEPWQGKLYYQLVRKEPVQNNSFFGMAAYIGASISDPSQKLYEKVSFKDMLKRDLNKQVKGGWVAMQQRYFLSAWIPESGTTHQIFSQVYQGERYAIGLVTPVISVNPTDKIAETVRLYIGPEKDELLSNLAPGLEMTIDYGWLWFISAFLFWLMKYINQFIHNWGWSIVLVTLLIKLVFYRLSAASYRSMANLRKFQPRIEALKERYADDKQKFSQAMLELYRQEKINPLGGCLPIIVQIPVFIALYWVLLESVELRHAPFMFWIHDLSAKDPYYVLPIIMGLSMLVQQRMTPAPPDPVQAKVMMALPIVFTFLFLQFPSGLVLYWVVNNILSILQQWYITYRFAAPQKSS